MRAGLEQPRLCCRVKTALKRCGGASTYRAPYVSEGTDDDRTSPFRFARTARRLQPRRLRPQQRPTAEEKVNAKWGNLQADYQRRADLIPNLVDTVKGYAQQEKRVLIEVTQARAERGRVQLSAERPRRSGQGAGVQRGAEPADPGDHPAAAAAGGLSGPQVEPEFPGAAGPARRHREPHQRVARATITRRCRPITPASAPSPTRSAPRSSTAPSPRCRSRPPPAAQNAPTVDFNTAG